MLAHFTVYVHYADGQKYVLLFRWILSMVSERRKTSKRFNFEELSFQSIACFVFNIFKIFFNSSIENAMRNIFCMHLWKCSIHFQVKNCGYSENYIDWIPFRKSILSSISKYSDRISTKNYSSGHQYSWSNLSIENVNNLNVKSETFVENFKFSKAIFYWRNRRSFKYVVDAHSK